MADDCNKNADDARPPFLRQPSTCACCWCRRWRPPAGRKRRRTQSKKSKERGDGGRGQLACFLFFRRRLPPLLPPSIVTSVRALRAAAASPVDPTAPLAEGTAPPPPSPDAVAAASKLRVFCDALARAAASLDSRRHEGLLTEVLAVGAWGVDEVRQQGKGGDRSPPPFRLRRVPFFPFLARSPW